MVTEIVTPRDIIEPGISRSNGRFPSTHFLPSRAAGAVRSTSFRKKAVRAVL